MQDFAGNNLVGTIPYFVVETFNQPLRRHWNLLRRSCANTSSGLKFLKHADSTPSTHFLKSGADTPLTAVLIAQTFKRHGYCRCPGGTLNPRAFCGSALRSASFLSRSSPPAFLPAHGFAALRFNGSSK